MSAQSVLNDIYSAILGCPSYAPTDGVEGIPFSDWNLCPTNNWQLVFHDEFNGEQLDSDKWYTYYPFTSDGSDQALITRTSENGNVVNLDENVFLSDGVLKIRVKNQATTWYGQTKPFSGGVIFSKGNQKFYKGRFEMRCKIPFATGAPLVWPAFWMHGGIPNHSDSESEIDVFEFCGNLPSVVKTDMHRFYQNGSGPRLDCHSSYQYFGPVQYHEQFHVFAVEWDHYYLKWYVDGQLIRSQCSLVTLGQQTVTGCAVAQGTYGRDAKFPRAGAQLNVIANCAVARSGQDEFCGEHDQSSAAFPLDFEIDWIRVYQRDGMAHHPALYSSSEQLSINNTNPTLCQGQEATIGLDGPAGNISWSFGPGLTQVGAIRNSLIVRATTNAPTYTWVQATSTGAPMANGNGTRTAYLYIGPPELFVTEAHVPQCGNNVLFTCHAALIDGYVAHRYFVDGVELTEGYNPSIGTHYPIEDWHQQVYYHLGDDPGDFCIPYQLRVENDCGFDQVDGVVRDNCIYGPCNLADPGDVDQLVSLITTYPNPSEGFTLLEIDNRIDLSVIRELEVVSSLDYTRKWIDTDIQEHLIALPTSGWTPGVYYLYIKMVQDIVRVKIQIKI